LAAQGQTLEALRLELSEHRIQLLDYNKIKQDLADHREREMSYLQTLRENHENNARMIRDSDVLKLKLLQKEDELGRTAFELQNAKLKI
jgi:hypothetical protein